MQTPHTCRSSAETNFVEQPVPGADQASERWRQRANAAADRLKDRAKDQTREAGTALHRDAKSLLWRNRRQLAPLGIPVAALALGEAGAALAQTPELGELLADFGTDVVAAGGAAGAWFWLRNKLAGKWDMWRSRVSAGLAGSATWAGLLPLTGAEQPAMYAGLTVGTLGLAARWWQHHRPGYPAPAQQKHAETESVSEDAPPPQEQGSEEGEPDPLPAIIENWNKYVRPRGGPLPGAEIDELGPITAGESYRVHLSPAAQTLGTAQAAHERIAGGLRISPQKLLIEADTSTEDPNDLELRVVRHSPITGTVYFDQPRYHVDASGNGRIELGPYADGEDPGASYALYGPNSMFGGYVLGSTRSGKSRLTEEVALTALSPQAPPTVLVVVDGQEGASSQTLWDNALWRGGPGKASAIAKGLLAQMRYREKYIQWRRRRHGGGGFVPSVQTPGVLVVVDECDAIFKEAGELFADLARRGGKNGFGVLAASQVVDLSAFGTGGDALRSSLVSGNGIAMKTTSGVQGTVFPGLNADLTKLPPYGYGYTAGGGQAVSHRTAQFRTRFLPDRGDAERMAEAGTPLPGWVRTVEDWFAEVSSGQELSEDMGRVAGDAFLNRHEEAESDDADLDAMFGGDADPVELFQQSQQSGSRSRTPRSTAGAKVETASVTPLFAGGFGDLATADSASPSAPAAEPAPAENRHQEVLDLLSQHGPLSTSQLAELLGISEVSVRKRLRALGESNRVRETATRGVYARAS